jgi:hypothetical protein
MKQIKKVLFVGLLRNLSLLSADAQMLQDIAGVAINVNASTEFNDVPTSGELNKNKFDLITYDVWLPIVPPLKLGRTTIFTNVFYRYFDFNYENKTGNDPYVIDDISEIRGQIIVLSPISKRLSILAITIPTFASDFKGAFSSDDLILNGIYGVSKKFGKNANLEIGFGPNLMYSFGEFMVTPGISIDYQSTNKKWIAQFYWPRLNVLRNFSDRTQLGIVGSIDWTRYNLKDYVDIQGKTVDYGQHSTIRAGIQFNQRLFSKVWLQLQGCVGLANSYTLYDSQNKTVREFSFDPKPYGRAMLSFRINR